MRNFNHIGRFGGRVHLYGPDYWDWLFGIPATMAKDLWGWQGRGVKRRVVEMRMKFQ